MRKLPLQLAAEGIDRPQRTPEGFGVIVRKIRAAVVGVALFVRLPRGCEDVALLARRDVEKFGLRIVGWRHPVGRAGGSRAYAAAFGCGRGIQRGCGTALSIFAGAPTKLGVGSRENEFSCAAIEQIKKSVAVGLRDQ